jgi:Penicillin binding protein transpeptidase domain/NTF2-like N-terminal transpeptidase domain/Penicillin-binding Protein dimerisation domain
MYSSDRRRKRWFIAAVVAANVLVLAAAGAVVGYRLLRTQGSPQQTAAGYLAAWQRSDYRAMDRLSIGAPRSGLAGPVGLASAELGIRRLRLRLRRVLVSSGSARASFTVSARLASGRAWDYQGQLRLIQRGRRWWVNWSPAAIYPGLRTGDRFALRTVWPPRAQVLAANGAILSSPRAFAESGSISLLTGLVVTATARQANQLGAPYQAGDQIGLGGIEQAYERRLAGQPALTIQIVGPGRRVEAVAARFAAVPGRPVRTTIDMRDQLAASHAVGSALTRKPVDLVAIQPSTGRVLAVVEHPGGYDRALQGTFPPGSTFKIVTAAALAKAGLRPDSTVRCPASVTIDGRTFHNINNEHLGTTSLRTAFAVSCNSTFALLATQRLDGAELASAAARFGFNARPELGIPAVLGQFTVPSAGQPVLLAADAFGQGTDLASPLGQAAEAAAVEDGSWRPPLLVTRPAPRQATRPRPLSPVILRTLRPLMRAVVTSGTAAGIHFPPGVHGKTGSAEYGSGRNPPSHAWFIGYRGDLAFAVIVEGGGIGAVTAAPIAAAFLRRL